MTVAFVLSRVVRITRQGISLPTYNVGCGQYTNPPDGLSVNRDKHSALISRKNRGIPSLVWKRGSLWFNIREFIARNIVGSRRLCVSI